MPPVTRHQSGINAPARLIVIPAPSPEITHNNKLARFPEPIPARHGSETSQLKNRMYVGIFVHCSLCASLIVCRVIASQVYDAWHPPKFPLNCNNRKLNLWYLSHTQPCCIHATVVSMPLSRASNNPAPVSKKQHPTIPGRGANVRKRLKMTNAPRYSLGTFRHPSNYERITRADINAGRGACAGSRELGVVFRV